MGQCVWRGGGSGVLVGAECDSKTPLQEAWGRRQVDWQMAPDTSASLTEPEHEGTGPSLAHPAQGSQHKAKGEERERENYHTEDIHNTHIQEI